jgi:hypothetical protein
MDGQNIQELCEAVHQLRGTGSSYGFSTLSAAASAAGPIKGDADLFHLPHAASAVGRGDAASSRDSFAQPSAWSTWRRPTAGCGSFAERLAIHAIIRRGQTHQAYTVARRLARPFARYHLHPRRRGGRVEVHNNRQRAVKSAFLPHLLQMNPVTAARHSAPSPNLRQKPLRQSNF